MKKEINEVGKWHYTGAELNTPITPDLFQDVSHNGYEDSQFALHTNLGSLTVLNRLTGFGWRDTESGYRDTDGIFWLASGNYDVMCSDCKTIGEAIEWVKHRANACVAAGPWG